MRKAEDRGLEGEGGVTVPMLLAAGPRVQGWAKVTKGKMRFRGERVRGR